MLANSKICEKGSVTAMGDQQTQLDQPCYTKIFEAEQEKKYFQLRFCKFHIAHIARICKLFFKFIFSWCTGATNCIQRTRNGTEKHASNIRFTGT